MVSGSGNMVMKYEFGSVYVSECNKPYCFFAFVCTERVESSDNCPWTADLTPSGGLVTTQFQHIESCGLIW